jgi:hypothetical protein
MTKSPTIALIVLLALALYFAAYRFALNPNTLSSTWPSGDYRYGGHAAEIIFWPAYQADRLWYGVSS